MRASFTVVMLLFVFSAVPVHADYDADKLKKLFTDRKQRMQMDAKRSGKQFAQGQNNVARIDVQGYVKRKSGKSVAWVNNKNTLPGSAAGNIRVDKASIGKYKKVAVTVSGKHVHLKPGESWSEESGITDIVK